MTDVFLDSVRAAGDVAGVLEIDDETAYFYLCLVNNAGNPEVQAATRLGNEMRDLNEDTFEIVWSDDEQLVTLRGNGLSRVGYRIEGIESGKIKFERMVFSA